MKGRLAESVTNTATPPVKNRSLPISSFRFMPIASVALRGLSDHVPAPTLAPDVTTSPPVTTLPDIYHLSETVKWQDDNKNSNYSQPKL